MKLPRLRPGFLAAGGATRRRSARKVVSATSLTLVASTLVLLAVNADGTPISDLDLHDGSVWVTNTQPGYHLLGRLNPQIQQLDLGIQALSGDFDVFQDGTTVFLDVRSGGRALRQVDVAAGAAHDPIALTPTTTVAFGGDTFAILDRESGAAWVRSTQSIQGFSQEQTAPDLEVSPDSAVSVGTDGTGHFFDPQKRQVTSARIDDSGLPAVGDAEDLAGGFGKAVASTVVGDTPVLFDRDASTLTWPGADQPLTIDTDDPSSVRLQAPGADAEDGVYVATRSELLLVDLDGGDVETVRDGFDGPPAAPVVHRGYVHAAWADPDADGYVRLGGDDTHAEKIPDVSRSANLVFRVNRDVVVLNDVVTGISWLVQQEGLPRVDNWDDVHPAKQRKQTTDPEPDELAEVRRTEENRPPQARDDELGARPGADSLLPVTRNDVDLDGDILTVADVKHVSGPRPEEMSVVGDGTMVQVRFGPNQGAQQARFRYTVSDGRENGTAEATATVQVVPQADNRPPQVIRDGRTPRQTSMTVARGQRAQVHVLKDWTDADGDPLVLSDATLAKGGTVTFRPDGMVEFIDDGQGTGEKTIEVTVSDGHPDGTTEGKIVVNVSRNAGVPPELVPDRAVGLAGTDILVAPLTNDFSRDGTPLHLRDVVPLGGLEITSDPTTGTFVARTAQPGTYYLDYSAYSDRGEASSFVRLDVLPGSDENRPPVAMRDEALIPPGGHALVDLLANDADPENDVLAITEVQVAPDSGVKASLLENRMLRLEASRDLTAPVAVGYTVSDGVATAQGSVTVGQAGLRTSNRPPVAENDRITVRAGAVATVPVLGNDFDPDGDTLLLHGQDLVKPDDLPLFVSGTTLRLRAPEEPGEVRASYGVRDSRGQRDDAELVIDVIADDPEINAAPRPDPVVARAVGLRPVRIGLDLASADPDGDAVSLTSLRTAPTRGRIIGTGLDWLEYEPYEGVRGGTDTFEVEVQDKYGAVGLQTVQVGTVPRSSINQAPVALADQLSVRPGRTIQYNTLGNDNDPDGDDLFIDEDLVADDTTTASIEDGFVTLEIPDAQGGKPFQTSVVYGISDGAGGTDQARFTVDASPDAPLHAPITQDDVADLADVAGKKPGDTVKVDVLENDGDLDGRRADLRLAAFDRQVSSVVDGQLNIELAATDQVVVYEVSDNDDNISYGFVFVTGTDTVPPVIDPSAKPNPVEVEAGSSVEIDLTRYVLVRAGRTPVLTVADRVTSAPFASAVKVVDETTLRFSAPAKQYGPASVTFEVTDGEGLNDATGLTSVLTLPVDVIPPEGQNVAPQLRDLEVLVVAGDDAEEKRVDIAANASDANPDDTLTFSATSTDSVEARTEGSVLVLNARGDVVDGEVSDVPIAVTDSAGASAEAVARVRLVRSDKPLVDIGTIGPIEAEAGEPVSVDVNDHAANPYEGQPLTVSDGARESGEGSVVANGSTITVTPAARFSGSLVGRFRVQDGSGDPAREVVGRIEVTVVAAPEPPGRPTVSSMTHDSVTLSWQAAEDKGAPVTDHEVTWPGGSKTCGPATTCVVDGLTPGKSYAFQVAATNRVGTSEPSAASEEVTPDKVPDRMAPPTIAQDYTARDGRLTLSWQAPANVGSAIRVYEIQRLGTDQVRTATSSPFIWEGLKNGESEQFRIRAVNDITDEARKQLWSEASLADKPFGVPAQVARPTGVASADDGLPGGRVEVTWSAPDANGDPISHYEVTMKKDGQTVTTKREEGTSSHFEVDNGHDYTFVVVAHNRAGGSKDSAPSDPVNPWDKATAVQGLAKVDAGEGDRTGRISFSAPADDGGRPVVEYRISSTGGPTRTVSSAGTHDVTFNANNGPYTVTVTPVTQDAKVGKVEGRSATVDGIRPFGAPLPPSGGSGAAAYRQVNFSGWSAGTAQQNGRPVTGVQYRRSDSSTWTNGTSHNWPTEQGGDQRCIFVRTVAQGRTPSDTLYSGERQICGRATPRKVIVYFENAPTPTGNCTRPALGVCKWVKFRVEGFRQGTYNVPPPDPAFIYSTSITVGSDGRGNASKDFWYTGFAGTVTVTVDGVSGSAAP